MSTHPFPKQPGAKQPGNTPSVLETAVQKIDVSLPPDAALEIVTHTQDDDERMWMQRGEHVWTRPLMFNVVQGSWVNLTRATGEAVISRHRHPAPVTGYTLEGSWGYLEHEWTATAGTFIFEPAGETHTLVVRPDEGHMLVLFHNFGPLLHVDEDGSVVGYEDVFTRLAKVRDHYRKVGLGDEFVDQMIR